MRPLLFAVCCLLLDPGCKRKDDTPVDYGQGTGRCRIVRINHYPGFNKKGEPILFTYDDQNRLSGVFSTVHSQNYIIQGNVSTDYRYAGDTIFALHHSSYVPDDTIILNSNRQIKTLITKYYGGYNANYILRFSYNAENQLTAIRDDNHNIPEQSFTYKDDDLLSDSTSQYAFYTDRLAQFAAPTSLSALAQYGVPFPTSKHLEKATINTNNYIYSATYTFDTEGKIIADTINTGISTYYNTFTYECH